jgi:hypothetical protein
MNQPRNGLRMCSAVDRKATVSLALGFSVLLVQLLLCPLASGQATDASDDTLSLRWAPPCDLAGEPLFAVDIDRDGNVRYVGGELAREVGVSINAVSKRAARRLFARAARVASRASGAEVAADPPPRLPYDHCLRFTLPGEPVEVALSSREPSTLDFALAVDEHVHFTDLICPARAGDANPISVANYCETARVSLHLRPDDNCLGLHVVNVYENGLVHYYAASFRLWAITPFSRTTAHRTSCCASVIASTS